MGETIEKVQYLQKKLESYSCEEFPKIISVLQKLDKLPVSIEVLQGTGIGKVVNTFRKHDGGVSEHARSLVKKWKALVQAAMDAEPQPEENTTKHTVNKIKKNTELVTAGAKKPHKGQNISSSSGEDIRKNYDPKTLKESPKPEKNIPDKKIKSTYTSSPKPSKSISSNSESKEYSLKDKSLDTKIKCERELKSKHVGEKRKGDKITDVLVEDSRKTHKSNKTILNDSSKKESSPKKVIQTVSSLKEGGSDQETVKNVSDEQEPEGLEYKNTGLSFADCLLGSLPASPKSSKLKQKTHNDFQKSPSFKGKQKDSKRQGKNDRQKTTSDGKTNLTAIKSDTKIKKDKFNHCSDEVVVDKREKNDINVIEDMKQKIKQKDKHEPFRNTVQKTVSKTDKNMDKIGSKGKSQTSPHKHQVNIKRGENILNTLPSKDKHKNQIKKVENISKTLASKDKYHTNTEKEENIRHTATSKDKSKFQEGNSAKGKTDKTIIDLKKDDEQSSQKSQRKKVENPKEKTGVKDKVKKGKKRVYSSGDESEDEICFENTGLSFGDCLFGDAPMKLVTKQKKKKKTVLEQKKGSKFTGLAVKQENMTKKETEVGKKLVNISNDSSSDTEKKRKSINPKETPAIKKIKNCYDAGILLPEINTDYKPLPRLGDDSSPRKRSQAQSAVDAHHQLQFKGAKESRTKVFSGKARVYLTAVPTLFDACMRILCDNIDLLEDVGGVPFDILKPVMERCTYQQLYRLEEYNPHFIEDSDYLWKKHVEKEFKLSKPNGAESWRECYLRSFDEREQKFKLLTENITASYAKKDTGRKMMLAYVDRPAKAPRNVRRKQEQHGTAGPVVPHEAFSKPHKKSPWAVPKNEDTFSPPTKPARTTKIIAPMMQKTLRFIKGLQRR